MRNVSYALIAVIALIAVACGGSADAPATSADGAPSATATEPATSIADIVAAAEADSGSATGQKPGGEQVTSQRPTQLKLETPERERLVHAVQNTGTADSYQFAWSMQMNVPELGDSLSFTGGGSVDPDNERFAMTIDFSDMFEALANSDDLSSDEFAMMEQFLGDGAIEFRYVDGTSYINWALFGLLLGADTPWVAIEDPTGSAGFDAVAGTGSFSSPQDALAMLTDVWGLDEIGRETVRGVETTHYRGTIDFIEAANALSPDEVAELEADLNGTSLDEVFGEFPVDVWIDDDEVLRRFTLTYDFSNFNVGGRAARDALGAMTMTYEFFEIGSPVSIAAPPAADVTEVSDSAFFGGFDLS